LLFASVIEEECTGNGTLAAARSGVLADAVLLPEPTGLDLLLAGVGILWLDVAVVGRSAHAESADRAVNPVDLAFRIVERLRDPGLGVPGPGLRAGERRSARAARGGGPRGGPRQAARRDTDGQHDRRAPLLERIRRAGPLLRTNRPRHPRHRRVGRALLDRRR